MRWIVHASLLAFSMPGPAAGGDSGPAVDPAALLIPADAPELSANAALRGRLRSSPHSYYRGIGPRFTAVICQRFAERAASVPTVMGRPPRTTVTLDNPLRVGGQGRTSPVWWN